MKKLILKSIIYRISYRRSIAIVRLFYLAILATTFNYAIGIELTDNEVPEVAVNMARFESNSHNHPLRNPYKYWIGELSYDWLSSPTNQAILGNIWNSRNSFGESDGWFLDSPLGNQIIIKSYWEQQYSNSFSFSVPNDPSIRFSIALSGNGITEIKEWSDLGYVTFLDSTNSLITTDYETGVGTVIASVTNTGSNRYYLAPGGIYSVSQAFWSTNRGGGESTYTILIEPIPEAKTYTLTMGIVVVAFMIIRRKIAKTNPYKALP